jgi:hypothetical protein
MRSSSNDAVGVEINAISFPSLLRALRALPGVQIGQRSQDPMNDEAHATFEFKNFKFEINTPLSDYWIHRPENCPSEVFDEIVSCLEQFRVRWWHRIF